MGVNKQKKSESLSLVEIASSCKILMESNFNFGFKCVQDAIVATQFGTDLGFTKSASWKNVQMIKGQPSISSKAKLGLIKIHEPNFKIRILKRDTESAKIKIWMDKNFLDESVDFEWTLEDAKRSKLINKDNWQKSPRQMLWARVISEMADALYPEYTNGIYTPEQLIFFEEPKKLNTTEKKEVEKFDLKNVIDVDLDNLDLPPKPSKTLDLKLLSIKFKEAKAKGFNGKLGEFKKEYFIREIEFVPEEKIEKIQEEKIEEPLIIEANEVIDSDKVTINQYTYLEQKDIKLFNGLPPEIRHITALNKNRHNILLKKYNSQMKLTQFRKKFCDDNCLLDFQETVSDYDSYIKSNKNKPGFMNIDKFIAMTITDKENDKMVM